MKLKIENLQQTGYRAINALNASAIKLFDRDRNAFYREFVLGEKRKDKKSDSIVLGNLVDFALSDCNGNTEEFESRFHEKFFLMSVKRGSGQMFDLADEIYKITLQHTDEEGNITTEFFERLSEAFTICQQAGSFKGKTIEWVVEKWENDPAAVYFGSMIENLGKTVIDEWMLEKAKKCIENVVTDENVGILFRHHPQNTSIENLGKYVIQTEYQGYDCKCEIDKLIIDHDLKLIIATEIKTNWDIEDGFEYTVSKLRYDLAAIFYKNCIIQWMNTERKDLQGYQVEFQFLTVDTSPQNLRPLVRPVSAIDMQNFYYGYKIRGKRYKGLFELMQEIKWCSTNQIWNISKEAYENNSVLPLNMNYGN